MRRTSILVALAGLLAVPTVASAQATDMAVTRQQIQADRQSIVAENLPLPEAQASAFWPVYQAYRADIGKVTDQLQSLLTDPVAGDTVTDKEITYRLAKWFSVNEQRAKVQNRYMGKFTKAIGAQNTLRFYQIENRLDLIVEASIASAIPLVPVK
jgi:hypothetical protein